MSTAAITWIQQLIYVNSITMNRFQLAHSLGFMLYKSSLAIPFDGK